jgi:small subunit ribosomal protein S16
MSVQIRLRRVGRRAQPYYRVVVIDSRAPRGGAYLENIGFYNSTLKPAELRLDLERVEAWVSKGAGLSDTVASLVRKARRGGDRSVRIAPMLRGGAANAGGDTAPAASEASAEAV